MMEQTLAVVIILPCLAGIITRAACLVPKNGPIRFYLDGFLELRLRDIKDVGLRMATGYACIIEHDIQLFVSGYC
ncbi:hypothetical protein BVRB_5g125000 [Beta vulgaris subsp. vulgaris]|uniref:Secreted protein n=1 Tax=Beta vulgaris subsp. vulgaris TaxID=3555 RepID=A0A0J8E3H6_BETVV|nr:hypothetical protein BVRB_5g125000 [Beta vulgaris subsp. vulgaris]